MLELLQKKIILYIYNISKQPIKLKDLLTANQLFNDGMKLDGTKLGFRLRLGRAYLVFIFLIHLIIIPIAFLTHTTFRLLDCHASIIIAIFFTVLLFGLFSCFKEWSRDFVTKERIKIMWVLHFPHFPYDEYNQEITNIYQISVDEEIKQSDLERFILDKLSS